MQESLLVQTRRRPEQAVPVRGGRLRPGTWQGVALVERDGAREREIVVDVRG